MPARGFTLVEMLVVLAVLGLIGGLMAPGLQGRLAGRKLDTAIVAGLDELRARQAEALLSGHDTAFSLTASPSANAEQRRRLRRMTAVDARLETLDGGRADQLIFLPGGWSAGGRLRLRDGEREAVLRVDWPLGTIRQEKSR